MSFRDDLERYGPGSPPVRSLAEARAYCAGLTASHYENFRVVTALTPKATRPALESIYAFCRWSDDLGDEVGDPARATELLNWWRGELDRMDAGEPRHPVMVALRETVREYQIPPGPFRALISAFEQDQTTPRYDTDAQLRDYCTRSADPVGHLVLCLARAHTPENVALSDSICTGLQLANFWQDVARDWAIGRIYLPGEDRERHEVAEADFARGVATPGFRALLRDKVEQARALLQAGRPLADRLPRPWDLSIELFARGGLAVLDKIAARDYDVWSQRPKLNRWDFAATFLRALARRRLCPPTRAA